MNVEGLSDTEAEFLRANEHFSVLLKDRPEYLLLQSYEKIDQRFSQLTPFDLTAIAKEKDPFLSFLVNTRLPLTSAGKIIDFGLRARPANTLGKEPRPDPFFVGLAAIRVKMDELVNDGQTLITALIELMSYLSIDFSEYPSLKGILDSTSGDQRSRLREKLQKRKAAKSTEKEILVSQEMPLKQQACSNRFCENIGPLSFNQVACARWDAMDVLVSCKRCSRTFCAHCAWRRPTPENDVLLSCPFCQIPLGTGSRIRHRSEMDRETQREFSLPTGFWMSLTQDLIKQGALVWPAFLEAQELVESEHPDLAFMFFESERGKCIEAGYETGVGRCLIAESEILYNQQNTSEALMNLEIAEEIFAEMQSKLLLRKCLNGQLAICKMVDAMSSRIKAIEEKIRQLDS